jgi:hypothetical protein
MSFKSKILITVVGIVGFDAVSSFVSRSFQLDYRNWMWLSFFLYAVVGFWGAHRRGAAYGMLLGTLAGLADSTFGWFVSRMIGPFVPNREPSLEPLMITIVVIVVTISGFVLGSVGALLCKLLGRSTTVDA